MSDTHTQFLKEIFDWYIAVSRPNLQSGDTLKKPPTRSGRLPYMAFIYSMNDMVVVSMISVSN